ncbi:MAG: hypothetical protein PXZ08_11605 [Actinomycetota bacterium]|jgi:hypothetical protein|nr:hypothetical protein [Actinomycetota bacterium]
MNQFPEWTRERLEQVATNHAIKIAIERGYEIGDAPVDRLVVNMLRHEFSDYDADPTAPRHAMACRSIAAQFPWLSEECERQVARRTRDEKIDVSMRVYAEAQAEASRQWRAERVRESRAAIRSLTVGERVVARIAGADRQGIVTWIGRSKVEINYRTKSGAERWKRLYARDIVPVRVEATATS